MIAGNKRGGPTSMTEKTHESKSNKNGEKDTPPLSHEVFSSTKQSMGYFTVSGIEQRIGYKQQDFPIFCIKELLDNAVDFLNNNYRNPEDARIITVNLKLEEDAILRIVVRNSNDRNIIPFPDLRAVVDYDYFYSSKRNIQKISCGAQGDALKEILAMGYALVTNTDTADSFKDKQWNKPLIFRFNGKEYKVYIRVNKAEQDRSIRLIHGPPVAANNYVEVEAALPIVGNESGYRIILHLKEYCKKRTLFCNKIDFHFGWNDAE